ncbi:MAG: FAD-binding oxidoreductase [Gemmatimonadota bacterium]
MPYPPIEQSCYWLATRTPQPQPPLTGDRQTDYAIVGAGLTGLWTALTIRQLDPSAAVTIVEQGTAAFGASGRNAGMLSETVDHGHGLAIQHFGEAEARRLATLGESNIVGMYRDLESWRIDCDLERTGRLMVALTEGQLEECRRTIEVAERLGLSTFSWLDQGAVQAELHSPLYRGGVKVTGGGILNPVKLVDGLAAEARRQGITICEQSKVLSLGPDGGGVRLRTRDGSLHARKAILATSAYTHHLLPQVLTRFIPLYDYVLVSEPLTAAQHELLGWKGRQGVTDLRTFFNYYRPTADGRVLWGTSEAAYYSGNRVDPACDHSEPHYQSLTQSWRRHFPELSGLKWEFQWGGAICSTTRMTPYFSSAAGGKILYGLGYTGHGVGTTRLGGQILAHMALDRPSDLLDLQLVTRKPFPYPPEPIRELMVSMVTRGLRRVDAGEKPNLLLRVMERMGLGFSS